MTNDDGYVFDFTEGDKDQKDLLGGKGANLAEMTKLGLPVPPGFTITTEACREYLALGSEPGELRVQVTMALRHLEDNVGRRLGDRHDPLLVSVRSGAKFSMPGMMETVLNIGLNDASVKGLAEESAATSGSPGIPTGGCCRCSARRCWTCPARCSPTRWTRPRPRKGVTSDVDLDVDDLKALVDDVQGRDPGAFRRRIPAAPARAAGHGDPRGLRFLEHRPGPAVPPPRADPAGPGHRGQHLHHGVRQPRRDQRHRRGLHPRPGVRADRRVRRLPVQRAGRGRRRRHPQHAVAWTTWRRSTRRRTSS